MTLSDLWMMSAALNTKTPEGLHPFPPASDSEAWKEAVKASVEPDGTVKQNEVNEFTARFNPDSKEIFRDHIQQQANIIAQEKLNRHLDSVGQTNTAPKVIESLYLPGDARSASRETPGGLTGRTLRHLMKQTGG